MQDSDLEEKEKIIKYTVLAGTGVACLFMIRTSGLTENRGSALLHVPGPLGGCVPPEPLGVFR